MTINDPIIAFQSEVQLLGWAETNTRGRTITLQLDGEGDGHPFASARTKQGKSRLFAFIGYATAEQAAVAQKRTNRSYLGDSWTVFNECA